MPNELQTLNERIAERVGENLVDLIPAEQWQEIVDRECQAFYSQTAPKIIQEMLRERFRACANAQLDELCHTDEWNHITQQYTSSKLREFIGESGGEIFAAVLSPAMSQVMSDLRNRLQSGY